MEIIKTLTSKTCYFVIKTTFGPDFVAQESGSGTSGHLMRWTPPNTTTYNDYYKFLIYPDPTSEGKYRFVVVGWPEFQVQLESDRARMDKHKNSDFQRFIFKIAPPPAIEKDKTQEWNYLQGVGVNLNFDFASHRYVFPSTNSTDQTKLKFIPVDIIAPDTNRLKAPVKYSTSELAPPQNYEETNGEEWGTKVVSIEAIPAALITDDDYRNKSDQLSMSPYYYLKHERLWSAKQLQFITLSKNKKSTFDKEYTSAFKSSDYKSIEKTIGHTFNASIDVYGKRTGEVGVKDSGLSATAKDEVGAALKLAYQYQDQTKTIDQKTNSEEKSIKERIIQEYRQLDKDEGDIFIRHWMPVDRYTLTNSKGVEKGRWEYTNSNSPIPQECKR
ncbi:hypothetical protein Q4512_11845 [Oceanihabitans sp. 2_MG-2023]|uniref:hypothetical protein n=1 Tax=Oceanihabitans sp. 2_MG-2023 TaxID=3062661 RepID=UPI0026E449FE|nr:hypothetical protein [Oceanihabitans sp. 2_MG-2023]MDO6597609.1 hypothetical protein [Oceanihabitans sp. 2_MG-2023]